MNTNSQNIEMIKKITFSGLFLALALLLPFLTAQIPEIGSMLCPMHIPVLLCGFICGPWCGALIGCVAPLLRSLIFGMPPMFPTAVAMAAELLVYGLMVGILYRAISKKTPFIYLDLIVAMIAGRIVWGIVRYVFTFFSESSFSFSAFLAGAFTQALPGIIIQIVLIPIIVISIEKFKTTHE